MIPQVSARGLHAWKCRVPAQMHRVGESGTGSAWCVAERRPWYCWSINRISMWRKWSGPKSVIRELLRSAFVQLHATVFILRASCISSAACMHAWRRSPVSELRVSLRRNGAVICGRCDNLVKWTVQWRSLAHCSGVWVTWAPAYRKHPNESHMANAMLLRLPWLGEQSWRGGEGPRRCRMQKD